MVIFLLRHSDPVDFVNFVVLCILITIVKPDLMILRPLKLSWYDANSHSEHFPNSSYNRVIDGTDKLVCLL